MRQGSDDSHTQRPDKTITQATSAHPSLQSTPIAHTSQVEAFLLPPSDVGAGEARRRAALLRRVTEYSVLGIPVTDWPQCMREEELR